MDTVHDMAKTLFNLLLAAVLVSCSLVLMPTAFETDCAYGAITVGDNEIQGYEPQDIVSTDASVNLDTAGAAQKLEITVIKIVKIIMPILMVACVGIIVYNAARNIFRKPEDRVKMGELIKNMFINFFFILFAWVIVEGIVFIVTNGEMILFSTILE